MQCISKAIQVYHYIIGVRDKALGWLPLGRVVEDELFELLSV